MDYRSCAALSLIEGAALMVMHKIPICPAIIYLFLLLFLVQYLTLKIYDTFIYPYFGSPLRYLPGPKDHHFFIGQTLRQFRANGPYELYLSWSRKWPDAPFIRYISFGNSGTLLVNSLKAHQEVLQKNCYSFVKPPFFARIVGEVTGKGLVFAEGDEHRKQRRLLNVGIFSTPNIKKLVPVVHANAKCLANTIEDGIGSGESAVIEVVSLFSKATLDIIGLITLGKELSTLNSSPSFHDCYDRIFNQSALSSFITAVNTWIPLRKWLPIEANLTFVRANAEVKRILLEQIRSRKQEMALDKTVKESTKVPISRDILTYLLETRLLEEEAWTEDELLGYILTLPNNADPGYAELESLRYLNNFCREVLRVYAPAVMIWREARTDVIIDGTFVPKGTSLIISPQVAHFHPQIWGENCETFDPDRWDHLPAEAASPYAFESFSAGPRVCIGKGLAMLEFKAILIKIVSRFSFEGLNRKMILENYLTLRPKGGLMVRVKRRNYGPIEATRQRGSNRKTSAWLA
ncbi:cytochrome P450 [Zopfia rhizophila CBS 207.26]|uniref:Cytochrome P450 n=1 Tax=Zopfia rhizophila CBS 207.26 TaxID=1314779 RepID=A0A6A6EIZ9_9PEZI|nr:cytochrome P450 [Zopfia rhizophila CBS 207.26]